MKIPLQVGNIKDIPHARCPPHVPWLPVCQDMPGVRVDEAAAVQISIDVMEVALHLKGIRRGWEVHRDRRASTEVVAEAGKVVKHPGVQMLRFIMELTPDP